MCVLNKFYDKTLMFYICKENLALKKPTWQEYPWPEILAVRMQWTVYTVIVELEASARLIMTVIIQLNGEWTLVVSSALVTSIFTTERTTKVWFTHIS